MVLEKIREKAVGWVMWVFVGVVSVPFVLWGINQYAFGGGAVSAATVNGQEISLKEYADALQGVKNQWRNDLGDKYDEAMFDNMETKMGVVNSLVDKALEQQWMSENNMQISLPRVVGEIKKAPQFYENGKYSEAVLNKILQSQGLSRNEFVTSIVPLSLNKNDLMNGISRSAFATRKEAEQLYILKNQKRSFDYFTVSRNTFRKDIEISDEVVAEYYKNNNEKYLTDAKVKLEYIELSVETLGDNVAVTDDEIKKRYESDIERYQQDEQRKASHILLSVKKDASKEDEAKVKKQIDDIATRINKGESFADLAEEFSEDPGSAKHGGDLGFFGQKAMVPEFDEAVFSLEKGEVSKPVKTSFGYHLIKLVDIKDKHTKPLDDNIKGQIEQTIRAEKARAYIAENGTEVGNIAYDDPSSLEEIAKFAGVEIKETDFASSQSRKDILRHKKVSQAAFSDDLLKDGNNSDLISIGRNMAYVIRVVDHKSATVKPLEQVKSIIKNFLKTEKAKVMAKEKGSELEKLIAEGMSIADAAAQTEAKVTEVEPLPRNATKYSREVVQAAFEINKASGDAVTVSGVELQYGDYAVIVLKEVINAEIIADSEDVKKGVEQAAFSRSGELSQYSFANFMKSLRGASQVHIFEDRL